MKSTPLTLALLLFLGCASIPPQQDAQDVAHSEREVAVRPTAVKRLLLNLSAEDEGARDQLTAQLAAARAQVEVFFDAPFEEDIQVTVHPDRKHFTASFPAEWGLTTTECWMVAYGVADQLSALAPRVWAEQACEHDGDDPQHVSQILTHELVHVFHGQHNPTRDFSGAEQVGWFAEGLAVLASGQLSGDHGDADQQALAAERGPTSLETAWSGPWRYGVCGSLVRTLDHMVGRERLLALLSATTNAELMAAADTTEDLFLARWAETVKQRETLAPAAR